MRLSLEHKLFKKGIALNRMIIIPVHVSISSFMNDENGISGPAKRYKALWDTGATQCFISSRVVGDFSYSHFNYDGGMPSINIIFQEQGITAIRRSQKGIVAIILRDAAQMEPFSLTSITQIPETLGAVSQEYIKQAFVGYITPPRKVMVYPCDGAEKTLNDGLDYFAKEHFDYLVGPPDLNEAEAQDIALWVKSERLNHHTAKAVLPMTAADHEGIVNFATDDIKKGECQGGD